MDSAAFHELVAQIRGTAASLAEAEQKVAAFKDELAQQAISMTTRLCVGRSFRFQSALAADGSQQWTSR
jgi:hypothetical protein